ncbi:RagB/SusD family nutrient uptake outer membrane protein [Niabella aurantiaca]|uniref:RagB/SusD family nutrient uptake outer membrane protein n=1 Tax=Niabella aurantiaca TaxID=379900 RepID=UPI000379E8FA|nr:RagB/SusD family nutrient uptake outer membrane protein [Niabella aurantiaca]
MKLKQYTCLLAVVALISIGAGGCRKFLNVDPVNSMSGNNFWKSEDDVEKFITGTYGLLRSYTCMDGYSLLALADFRCAAWIPSSRGTGRTYISDLNNNRIRSLMSSTVGLAGSYGNFDQNVNQFGFQNMADWGYMYRIVTAANTILANIDSKDIADISDADRRRYKAEAVFIRSLVYFLMVRHWGDVPYVTEPSDETPHERMNQVAVFKNCTAALKEVLNDLPWTYSDPTLRGVRAMRGGALVLMMEMNMWMACFDEPGENGYYEEVVALGSQLIDQNGGAYELLPLESYKEIFKGTSKESLFEIGQDYNYGETFGLLATIADIVLRTPYKKNVTVTYAYYATPYLMQLYDEENNGLSDKRIDMWFERPTMYDGSGQFVFKKFLNTFATQQETENPNDAKILFRYVDAYLLRAEALEKLGRNAEALADVNVIRTRAGAELFTGTETNQFGQTLEDAIWWERERELMGESATFYDLVRTKRILSGQYTPFPITYDEFLGGAWTYPIHPNVILRNPKVKPNPFWM